MTVCGCSVRDSWETPIPTDTGSPYHQMSHEKIFPVTRRGRMKAIDRLANEPFVKMETYQLWDLIGVTPCERDGFEFYLVRGVHVRGSSGSRGNIGYVVFPLRDGVLVNYYGPATFQPDAKWPLVLMLPNAPKRVLVQVLRGGRKPCSCRDDSGRRIGPEKRIKLELPRKPDGPYSHQGIRTRAARQYHRLTSLLRL
jgi:hypothetical protein